MRRKASASKVGSLKSAVFTLDAIFAGVLAAIAVLTFSSMFSYAPSTMALHELAMDELTVFDKTNEFEDLYNCPGNRDDRVRTFLNDTALKVNSYAFAFMNVSIYRDSTFDLQCTASGSVGAWTNTRSSSKRVFSIVKNGRQYFGLAEITVGE